MNGTPHEKIPFGKWFINMNGDDFWPDEQLFDTKEAAIAFGKKHYEELFENENSVPPNVEEDDHYFYVGQAGEFKPKIDADFVIEQIHEDLYDKIGDGAEDYLDNVKKEEMTELEKRLNEVLDEWLTETDNHPTFYPILDVTKITVSKGEMD